MAVLGLLVGSFLNVVIFRLPRMMEREWRSECHEFLELEQALQESAPLDLVKPRSHCPSCGKQVKAIDNIPVISYLLLRGQCRNCKAPISTRYPLIELLSGVLTGIGAFVVISEQPADSVYLFVRLGAISVLVWYLIALAMIDADTKLLPDSMTLPLLWFGIALAWTGYTEVSLESAVGGAIFGYLSLWSVYWIFKLVTGKEGMGHGDFKLLAALAAWLGWEQLPTLILVSSVVGAIVGISMIAFGLTKRSEPLPFGPYLALAGILVAFWGADISNLFTAGGRL